MSTRNKIQNNVRKQVLEESGYRCGIPSCQTVLPMDVHHIVQVSDNGGNEASNLLPLCPNCHALHHRKHIPPESLKKYKRILTKSMPLLKCTSPLTKETNLARLVHTRIFSLGEFEVIDPEDLFLLTVRYEAKINECSRLSEKTIITSEYQIETTSKDERSFVNCFEKELSSLNYYNIAYSVPADRLDPGKYNLNIYEFSNCDIQREFKKIAIELRLQ